MANIKPEQREAILKQLRAGNQIAAIKLYKDAVGGDLKSAKEFVTQLQHALETGEKSDPNGNAQNTAHQISQDTLEEITTLLKRGEKIAAIKVYRSATGGSLRDSKAAVESIAAEQGLELKTSGCGATVLFLGLSIISLFYLTC